MDSPQMARNFDFVALVSAGKWADKIKIYHLWLPFLWLLSFAHPKESNKMGIGATPP
jgi:hypothetical protein